MNRASLVVVAVLVALSVALAVFRGSSTGFDQASAPRESLRKGVNPRAKGGQTDHRNGGPESPVQQLRDLLHASSNPPPRFSTVERLASRLGEADLNALRSETAAALPDSLGGWVRCAVFAELARRDPKAALDVLETNHAMTEMDFWGMRQAWFSTMRGWSETDAPAAAHKLLESLGPLNETAQITKSLSNLSFDSYVHLIGRDDIWKRQALQEVFAQLAQADPEGAWQALPEAAGGGFRESALEGFFRGLEGDEHLPQFMARWLSTRSPPPPPPISLDIEPVVLSFDSYIESRLVDVEGQPRISNFFERSSEQSIAAQAALSLAATDFRTSLGWALEVRPLWQSDWEFRSRLGKHYPEQALQMLESGSEPSQPLVTGLVSAHPELLSELAGLDVLAAQSESIAQAFENQSRLRIADLFPGPGRTNALPNFDDRYRSLVEAVRSGDFAPEIEQQLLLNLNLKFAAVVPEANAAHSSD